MALERTQNPFDAPIPGQSLTDSPKNYVWENPPRFTKIEDASIFVWERLQRKDTLTKMIMMLETGVSVESLTRVIIFSGFMEGAFNVDLAILLTPVVQKMIMAIGQASGIEKIKVTRPKPKETQKVLKDIFNSKNFAEDIRRMESKNKKDKEKNMEEETKEMDKGLMSRGKK